MRPGDHVITVDDPLELGVMRVMHVRGDGRVQCQVLATEQVCDFDPHELEPMPDALNYDACRARWDEAA